MAKKKKKKKKSYQTDEPCTACGTMSFDRCFHHVNHKGGCGEDVAWNMMPLCSEHHTEMHVLNNYRFAKKWENVKQWFIDNDWELSECFKEWNRYS